jgi:hypothetical protein
LKNSSTPKSKSTLCKMKGFLTSKLKKVSWTDLVGGVYFVEVEG